MPPLSCLADGWGHLWQGDPVATLVLLRHGESAWNAENRFTGWVDVDLTALGEVQARVAGALLAAQGVHPTVAHTSLLTRAVRSTSLALEAAGRAWLPVSRSWRLNERHYGALQGKDKAATLAEYGEEQFLRWRRSYDEPPPPVEPGSEWDTATDERYAQLAPEVVPATECLADVVVRLLPWWQDTCVPALRAGHTPLVVAHGNSLRALIKHLDGLSRDAVVGLNIPTGIPITYELDADLRPTGTVDPAFGLSGRYLDPAAAREAVAAVAGQGR